MNMPDFDWCLIAGRGLGPGEIRTEPPKKFASKIMIELNNNIPLVKFHWLELHFGIRLGGIHSVIFIQSSIPTILQRALRDEAHALLPEDSDA